MFLWTQRTQFWQTRPKNCGKKRKFIRSMIGNERKKKPSKVWLASEYSFGLVEDSFFNSTVFFSTKRQKFVTQYPKKIRKFSRKNSFASKCSHGHERKRSFNRLVGNFAKKPEVLSPENTKVKQNNLLKKFASEFSYGRRESCFDHPTETFFLQKINSFSFIVSKW